MDRATTAAQLRLHLARSGLSVAEAACLPDMPDHRTLRRWLTGEIDSRTGTLHRVNPARLDALYALLAAQDRALFEALALFALQRPKPARVEVRLAADEVVASFGGESAAADAAAKKHRRY